MLIRTFVFSLLLVTSFAFASRAVPVPPELAGCKIVKLWSFNNSAEGWIPDHNVSPFTLRDGVLSFRNTGFDPWIKNDNPDVDAGERSFIGIKMRSSVAGSTQIYFATESSPGLDGAKTATCYTPGDGQFHVCEVDLGRLPEWKGKLTQLRIDPVNGGLEQGAEVGIEWIAIYRIPPKISVGRPYIGQTPDGTRLTLPISNTGGEPSAELAARSGGVERKVASIAPRETVDLTFDLRAPGPWSAVVESGGRQVLEAQCQPQPPRAINAARIASGRAELAFHDLAPSSAELAAVVDGKRRPVGVFHPLGVLAYRDDAGVLRYLELKADSISTDGNSAVLQATRNVNGKDARFRWTFALPNNKSEGSMTFSLTCGAPIDVLRFEGPRLLVGEGAFGPAKTHALFPGLEYLQSGENSSSPSYVGPKYADRRVPHPFKPTVPLMAIEADGLVAGLSWIPHAEWADGQALPCAQFESPNQSGEANHLLTLFAPSIPDYVDENAELAKRPFRLAKGKAITISGSFFVYPGKITDVVPSYFAAHGTPKAPPLPRGVEGVVEVCFRAYTDSLYSPEKRAWKTHIGLHDAVVFRADYAAVVLAESLRKHDPEIARKCRIAPDSQLTEFIGTSLGWFSESAMISARSITARQAADGGFPYAFDEKMREKVKATAALGGIEADTLGEAGSTNSGLIAEKLYMLLRHALQTGKQEFIDAGLKGLAKMNTYTVPRGAGTWEVPSETPDVYAAGLAVDANVLGYHLTGDPQYLDKARFWAYTGLPFAYAWSPPAPEPTAVQHNDARGEGKQPVLTDISEFYDNVHRRVTPGATIAVFGTSFYVVNWFGSPVQWCGLAWANNVRRYLRLQDDKVLASSADAVFASGVQQQVEKGFLAGTYTDVWSLAPVFNSPVFIGPNLIHDYAYGLLGEKHPVALDYTGFNLGGERAYLSTYALIERCSAQGPKVQARLKYFAGQDLYTCIVRAAKPTAVFADGTALSESADLAKSVSGFYYDEANKALHIKYRPAARRTKLAVDW